MHGRLIKTSRLNAEDTESGHSLSTPEVAGMIWEEELMKDRRKREFWAFLGGGMLGACVSTFVLLFLFKLTGGCS